MRYADLFRRELLHQLPDRLGDLYASDVREQGPLV